MTVPADRVIQKVLAAGDRVHLRWGDQTFQTGGDAYFQSSLPVEWTLEPVEYLADGSWTTNVGSDETCEYAEGNAWVEMAIADLGPNPEVGIVWTADGWNTYDLAYANFVTALPDGRLQYWVDIAPVGSIAYCPDSTTFLEMEYAIFHFVNGEAYWDNNDWQNYRVILSE